MNFRMSRILATLMIFILTGTSALAADSFPNRKLYPTLSYIELQDFQRAYKDVVVVDVRSKLEYDILHIDGAVNISRASADFVEKMKELREGNAGRKIILYCNGKTCEQSYKAGKKCRDHNINDVQVYDGGVFEFATANPKLAILVGKTMASADKLIDEEKFKKHLISSDRFVSLVSANHTLVIDVRDKYQRDGVSLFIGMEKRADLADIDEIDRYIRQAKREKKTLLFYDNSGKQVRWLQYLLQDRGVDSYYFMEGGARGYFAGLSKRFAISQ